MARASEVKLGNGASIYWRPTVGGVGSGSFTKIPSAKSLSLPERDREEVDTTDLDSENNQKEYQLGDIDAGETTITIHINYANAVHQALDAASKADSVYEFKVVLNDSYYTTWLGRVKNFGGGATIERNTPHEGDLVIRNTSVNSAWTL